MKAPSLRETPDWGGGQTSTKLSKEEQRTAARYIWTSVNNVIEGQQLTYPNKSKSQIDNQYRYAGNLIEERLKSGKFNSMNEVLKDIEKSKPNSDYQAARKAAKMNGSGSDFQDFKKLTSTKITPKLRKAVESNLTKAGENLYEEIHEKGGLHISRADIHQAAELIRGSLRNPTSNTDTLDKIVGIIHKGTKRGAIYGDIARRLLKEIHNTIK